MRLELSYKASYTTNHRMFNKAFCFLALLGIFSVHAELIIEPGSRYYILDDLGNALTVTDGSQNGFGVSLMPEAGSVEQQWIFQISGVQHPNLEDDYWIIRPLLWKEMQSLNVSNDEDGWGQWLLDWSDSRLWTLRDAGHDEVQIVNNRYDGMCLQAAAVATKFPVTLCGGPFPAPLTPGTIWLIAPVS